MNRPVRVLLLFCILVSGFAALIYEIVWLRAFSQVFGNTVQSSAVVLAGFFPDTHSKAIQYGKAGVNLLRAVEYKKDKRVRQTLWHILAAHKFAPESSHLKKLYDDIAQRISKK